MKTTKLCKSNSPRVHDQLKFNSVEQALFGFLSFTGRVLVVSKQCPTLPCQRTPSMPGAELRNKTAKGHTKPNPKIRAPVRTPTRTGTQSGQFVSNWKHPAPEALFSRRTYIYIDICEYLQLEEGKGRPWGGGDHIYIYITTIITSDSADE